MDFECMYRPIQDSSMWYATHACVWRMKFDLLNRVCTLVLFTDVTGGWGWVWDAFDSLESSLWFLLPALEASEPRQVRIAWLTDRTCTAWLRDDHSLEYLHVLTLSRIYISRPFSSALPSFVKLSLCFHYVVFMQFLFMLLLLFFGAAASLKALVVFPWRDKASFTVVSAVFRSTPPIVNDNEDSSKTDIIALLLASIVVVQLKMMTTKLFSEPETQRQSSWTAVTWINKCTVHFACPSARH